MTSYLMLPFAFVFHAALLTCEKPAPTIRKDKIPDTIGTIIDEKAHHELYDNMPNAFEGMEIITVPNDCDLKDR
ncbi:hypothetical protein [Dyadobacter sp. BHUBP1]|uniref:hypothetical protein n=1 Tax=Dyadobacter sp. BHUBP1 TaxID=3424178 RepID=UPI003D33607E